MLHFISLACPKPHSHWLAEVFQSCRLTAWGVCGWDLITEKHIKLLSSCFCLILRQQQGLVDGRGNSCAGGLDIVKEREGEEKIEIFCELQSNGCYLCFLLGAVI